ncbi:12003_t:CDS:1, partial [Funneliformis caledonium]
MSKRKELSEGERNQIIGAWKCDVPVSVIKEKLNFASTTIKDVIKYYKNTSKVKPPPRSGRKPILTERDKRHLIHVVKEDRKVPLNVLNEKFTQATSTKVSTHTLR